MSVSIITPWFNASELLPEYEKSTDGAEVIIVDNGSDPDHAAAIAAAVKRNTPVVQPAWEYLPRFPSWKLIRNETNNGFSGANNQGLAVATGDIVIFMNNDVKCQPGFLKEVVRDVGPGALFGPSLKEKHHLPYIEGFCIAALRSTWDRLGGWDDQYYEGFYWEDNDLCFRALALGLALKQTDWPIWHYSNYTTKRVAGAYSHSAENERRFLARVAEYRNNGGNHETA